MPAEHKANDDFDYGSDLLPVGDNILAVIAGLAQEQVEAKAAVVAAEQTLDTAKAALREISTRRFPDVMMAAGQKKLTTATGLEVELNEVVRASIPEARQPEAFSWLADQHQDDVIKHELKAEVGKGGEAADKLKALCDFASTLGIQVVVKRAVHPMTLAKLIREMLAEGLDVPMDMLGAIVQKEVSVKPSKRK